MVKSDLQKVSCEMGEVMSDIKMISLPIDEYQKLDAIRDECDRLKAELEKTQMSLINALGVDGWMTKDLCRWKKIAEELAEAGSDLTKGNYHGTIECESGDPHFVCVCGLQNLIENWEEVVTYFRAAKESQNG